MSAQAMQWAIDQPVMSTGLKLLLLMLADGVDDHWQRLLAVQTIARKCSASQGDVRVWLLELEALGLVKVEEVEADGFVRTSVTLRPAGPSQALKHG